MYESHWKLSARPFENSFSLDSYYPSEAHQAALLKMRYAIENRRSVGILCGNSGMGKSMLLHQLRKQLPDFVGRIVNIVFPALSPSQFLEYFARQISPGDAHGDSSSTSNAIQIIESSLQKISQAGQQALLIIDEAEWLEEQGSLETLRLLLNLGVQDARNESALTVILSGHPNLIAQLERYPALDQRVSVRCLLNRFLVDETNAYIGHRLRSVGGSVESIFQTDSLDAIHHLCDGIPRRINSLCDLALMVGYAQEQSAIKLDLIENVHRELAPTA